MSEAFDRYRRDIEYCTYCPKLCRFSCPVAQVECTETVTPTGKMTILRQVRDGVIAMDSEFANLMYACSGCLISRTYCEHKIEVIWAFEAARGEVVKSGVAPERVYKYLDAWKKFLNPFGEDLPEKLKGIAPDKYFGKAKPVIVFTGCTTVQYHPEVIQSLISVLEALKVEFSIFTDSSFCCGFPIHTLGHKDAGLEQMELIAKALAGADTVITPCPTCANNLVNIYPEFGIELKSNVLHTSQFLADKISALPIGRREKRKVIYHDPCHLGRYLEIYDEPRNILSAVLESPLIEFYENRDRATCCGSGGGLPVTHPHTARSISKAKIKEFLESGAEVLATACPMCHRAFERAGRDETIVVGDIIQLLSKCLGGGEVK